MNKTILKFIANQDINMGKIEKLNEKRVNSLNDINWIVERYNLLKNSYIPKKVCIADIEGYNYAFMNLDNKNIINNMPFFYDEEKDGYATRSLSLLDITSQDIIDKLEYSFKRDPICLNEADEGKYVIGTNGLHRYHVIKAHYLKELSLLNKNDTKSIEKLKEKYTFETLVSEVDFYKTYSSFLLQTIARFQDRNIDVSSDYDMYTGLTGNVVFKNYDEGTQTVLDDEKLGLALKDSLENFLTDKSIPKKKFKEFFEIIKDAQENYASFNKFCEENLKEFIPYLNIKNHNHFVREDCYASI